MKITLRDYQQIDYDKILVAINTYKSILVSAACGYGKSVLIAHLSNTLRGRVLVLTHRRELLMQNSKLIDDYGVLDAKNKKTAPLKDCKVVVSMAQTIVRRLEKYGSDYVGQFDTIIIDECHLDFFAKIYNILPHKNKIGLTATPVIEKKETKKVNGTEMVRKLSLRDEYDFLIQGISEKDLIEKGFLVKDMNIVLTPPNLDELKNSNSNPDGYTSESLNQVFGNHASIETLYNAYDKYGKGKKTIIFNPTTKTNLSTYEYFKERIGEDKVRLFDSVNKSEYTRQETVEWFKSIPDAVLLNVGVFSVGFDVPELDVILFNKKTKSLQLFLQIAGRGSRTSGGKDYFTFVDMGLNIEQHGRWSKYRNWSKHFVINEWKNKRATDLLQVWECQSCGHYNLQGTVYNDVLDCMCCGGCGEPKPKKEPNKRFIKGKFITMGEPTFPKANKLIEHAKRHNGDGTMVLNMAEKQIVDLFLFYTDREDFYNRETKYIHRISEIYRPIYFSVINDKELKGKHRRLSTQLNRIIDKVKALYD